MKAKCGLLVIFSLFMVSRVNAELPVYISIDTSGGYSITGESFSLENEITLGKNFDILSGLYIEGGNWLGFDEEFSDEIFLGAGIALFPWLSLSLRPVLAVAPEIGFYLNPGAALSWEFEDAGITLSDDNNFFIYLPDGEFEYANTFEFAVSFEISRSASFNLGLSNDFAWAGEIQEGLSAGAGMEIRFFSFALYYDLGLLPEVEHGLSLNIAFNFN